MRIYHNALQFGSRNECDSVMQAIRNYLIHENVKGASDMQVNMDKLQFESRREIESVMLALDYYLEHEKQRDSSDYERVKEAFDKLYVMYIQW